MAHIQSAMGEIQRGKKKKKKKEETTGQKYNGLPYAIGRPYQGNVFMLPLLVGWIGERHCLLIERRQPRTEGRFVLFVGFSCAAIDVMKETSTPTG